MHHKEISHDNPIFSDQYLSQTKIFSSISSLNFLLEAISSVLVEKHFDEIHFCYLMSNEGRDLPLSLPFSLYLRQRHWPAELLSLFCPSSGGLFTDTLTSHLLRAVLPLTAQSSGPGLCVACLVCSSSERIFRPAVSRVFCSLPRAGPGDSCWEHKGAHVEVSGDSEVIEVYQQHCNESFSRSEIRLPLWLLTRHPLFYLQFLPSY